MLRKEFLLCCLFFRTSFVFSQSQLQITELNWNPLTEITATDTLLDDDLEFIEFKNIGNSPLDISNYTITEAVSYTFPQNTILQTGEYCVVARDLTTFMKKYNVTPFGPYSGKLSNKGERLIVLNTIGDTIIDFKYNNSADWPQLSNKGGYSMVVIDGSIDLNLPSSWTNSSQKGGSPGKAENAALTFPVIITEVLSNTLPPLSDAVELYNTSGTDIDISGWILTDKVGAKQYFTIPSNTIIKGNSFYTFYECSYNGLTSIYNNQNFGNYFGLSSRGESVSLISANNGVPTGYINTFPFEASPENVSTGLIITSDNKQYRALQKTNSLNTTNTGALPGEIVIDEIRYQDEDPDFIRLTNVSSQTVDMCDGYGNCRDIKGISFNKDSLRGISLLPGESIYLIDMDANKQSFRQSMSLNNSTHIFQYSGNIDEKGETLQLVKPGEVYYDENDSMHVVEYIEDIVNFQSVLPWPANVTSSNYIKRVDASVFGSEPKNWLMARVGIPVAVINGLSDSFVDSILTLDGSQSYDPGLNDISYFWSLVSAPKNNSSKISVNNQSSIKFMPDAEGVYVFKLVVFNGKDSSVAVTKSVDISKTETSNGLIYNNYVYPTITDDRISISENVSLTKIIISDFKLDVDSPFPKPDKKSFQTKPDLLKYPQKRMKYRYYGKTIENIIDEAISFKEGEEKDALIEMIANS